MPPRPTTAPLPDREAALRTLLKRQLRAVTLLLVRLVACGILLTLLKPLWFARPWLGNLFFTLGALLCGVPLLRDAGRNWSWRIALGEAYVNAQRFDDALAVLEPLRSIQGQLFDPGGHGARLLNQARASQPSTHAPSKATKQ
ncbi:hypothetical protein [Armatimonas rosea]|uniref:Uncharacterized protein n=1 Tax=Armatimonas rosea TaxID=685828 RepID=A0A7W9WA55_ARMRO|nr:hypothetical protein [Armatimonas rosea]MBB6053986.1 hypothetical protein [Armatimonas rosea]